MDADDARRSPPKLRPTPTMGDASVLDVELQVQGQMKPERASHSGHGLESPEPDTLPNLTYRIVSVGGAACCLFACVTLIIFGLQANTEYNCDNELESSMLKTGNGTDHHDYSRRCMLSVVGGFMSFGMVVMIFTATMCCYTLHRTHIARRFVFIGCSCCFMILSLLVFGIWEILRESDKTDKITITPFPLIVFTLYAMLAVAIAIIIRTIKTCFPVTFGQWMVELEPKDAVDSLQTGDVVFTSSTMAGAVCIKLWTSANWAHCGIIVRNPSQAIKDRFYCLEHAESNGVYVLEASSAFHIEDFCEVFDIPRDAERCKEYQRGVGIQAETREWGGAQLTPIIPWMVTMSPAPHALAPTGCQCSPRRVSLSAAQVCNREWGAVCMVRRLHGGHIDKYRSVITQNPDNEAWSQFMFRVQPLSYTDSFYTRMKGVWHLNESQGKERAEECFCSELVADALVEFRCFHNFSTNDSMPQHYALDDGRTHFLFDNDKLLGSGTNLPWNLEKPSSLCSLGPPMLLLPPTAENTTEFNGYEMPMKLIDGTMQKATIKG